MSYRLNIGISCYPTYGGSGVVATELGRQLARLGHRIHIISYDFPVRMPAQEPNITFHAVPLKTYALFHQQPYTISLAAKMAEVALNQSLDILHVHYAIPHAVAGYLARAMVAEKTPLKLVTTLHGTDITLVGSDPSFSDLVKFAIEESDAVTAVSRYLAEETAERFGVTRPIEMIHNFIDPADYYPPPHTGHLRRTIAPDDEMLICHISNFRPVKKAADAVEVFSRVRGKFPVKMLMVGDGVEMPTVVAKAHELGLSDSILFLGNRGDVREILEMSEVFIIPSESESFGLAALEAMASGCAVIGTTAGGIPEVITPATGFLHEPGDIDGMAASLEKLLEDDKLRLELKEGARKRAFSSFDSRAKVAEYIKCYQRILGREEPLGPEYLSPVIQKD